MRKIAATLFISLDGVVEAPDQWHFPYFDDDMGAAVDRVMGTADTLLLGRTTFDVFAGAWPDREAEEGPEGEFATHLGDMRKVVATSRPLESWRNAEAVQGDLAGPIGALKQEEGGLIATSGSISVVRQLLTAGLLDELHLLVHPVAVGKGMRLFEDSDTVPLRLLSSTSFSTGVLDLVYAPAEAPTPTTYDEAKAHLQS